MIIKFRYGKDQNIYIYIYEFNTYEELYFDLKFWGNFSFPRIELFYYKLLLGSPNLKTLNLKSKN